MNVPHDTDVDVGVLIAGGDSQRAGVDKRFLALEGRTLLVRNLDFLRALFPTVAVVIGRGQKLDPGDGGCVEVLNDAWPGASPLVGIATALAHFRRPVFALAVDIAFPQREAATAILAAYRGHDVSLPAIGRDYRQPIFAVYGPACLAPMVDLLESGRHRIVDIFGRVSVAQVPFPDDSPFLNINTMDDYRVARRAASAAAAMTTPCGGRQPALVAIVGKSRSGKTTLIESLVPELVKYGLLVGMVRHDVRGVGIDRPGKDSLRSGLAGLHARAIASPRRPASITRLGSEMTLPEVARRFFAGFDLVVAEGYQRTAPHRIELIRIGVGHDEPLCAPDEVLALVTDADLRHEHRFALGEAVGLSQFVAARLDTLRTY